ncbi:MAG: TonB-dependent receptor plug domain-containing protein, partial [Parvularculaceae bacterium]
MIASFLLAAASEEIVVTGERRARALEETPASISVLTAEEILNVNADHPSELLARSAGVFIARGNGQEHLTAIRSPVLTGGAGAGSFLFLEDGVPLRPAPFANVNELFEADTEIAERVEIVKGPSGAVYGANAIHGVVNVINRTPSDVRSFLGEVSIDTIGRVKTRGFISGPAGCHRLYAGVSVIHDPGYRDDSRADEQKLVLRDEFDAGAASILTTVAGY